ncbi:MAG: tRNA (adenosine(37)-N6)-dimethylallyltransferase MiaA [Rhabdochlamydiaceae bacterium]|nr:tRNA (adenosine(37)-N6)-dimethylallyltransferase MiaA [Candidatus Amphrikana amoebophyrae]
MSSLDEELELVSGGDELTKKATVALKSGKKRIIVIAGPTASGKTALSLNICKECFGEVISADSMQVFEGMDIGTAKVTLEERMEVPHHLIDIRQIFEPFNVVKYHDEAKLAMNDILTRGHVPLVVGGNGFYIHSLIYGPPKGPPSVPELRARLEAEMDKFGAERLYEKLKSHDPKYAATITVQDRHKIIRSLEIITLTGKKVSDIPKPSEKDVPKDIDFRCWFIFHPKESLYSRIEKRCDQMIEQGLINEVKQLMDNGLLQNSSAAASIGYRQGIEFINSKQTPEDWDHFVSSFKKASKQYAKRQFTWFKREPLFKWLDMSKLTIEQASDIILQDYEMIV